MYCSIDTTAAWKKIQFSFIGYISLPCDRLSIDRIPRLRSVHVDIIFSKWDAANKDMNLSTNFRGRQFRLKVAPSRLKHMYSVLSAFTWGPIRAAVSSRSCSRDLAWVGVFVRNAISSA